MVIWSRSGRGPASLCAALWLALALLLGPAGASAAAAQDGPYVLDVPYVSQEDGTPYGAVNCGPASVAMLLRALGVDVSIGDARAALSRALGGGGEYGGAGLETLATALTGYGLRHSGLLPGGRASLWNPEAIREALRDGRPMIAQVREQLLPGRAAGTGGADHYVVLVGLDGEEVAYHDPALPAPGEAPRSAPMGAMLAAMAASSRPFTAVAVAPAEGRYPVRVAAAAPAVPAPAAPAPAFRRPPPPRRRTRSRRRAGAPRARAGAAGSQGPRVVGACPAGHAGQPPPRAAAGAGDRLRHLCLFRPGGDAGLLRRRG